MSDEYREELLGHYQRELSYLRRMGAAFAESYPKVAARLEMGPTETPDPHIERLIESFAFLTGRIQQNLDAEFPQIPQALLGTLYPQFVNPLPSMAIAKFEVDPDRGKLTTGYTIQPGAPAFAEAPNGLTCRFRTGYPVTLWPLEIASAGFETTDRYDFLDNRTDVNAVLRLSIKTLGEDINNLDLSRLRFFLNGERVLTDELYELLFVQTNGVVLIGDDKRDKPVALTTDALQPVGFERQDIILEYPPQAQPAYAFLQEFFAFPEKFLFFDVDELNRADAEKTLDILFLLDRTPPRRMTVNAENFQLGCTPIVNLFRKTSEPIRLDERTTEYRLSPDFRRDRITEIHSIRSVTASNLPQADAYQVEPFFSFSHDANRRGARAFWHGRREASDRPGIRGSDMILSFLDLDFRPTMPATTTLYAHTLCTNRGLAEQLQAGALLTIEEAAPVRRIVSLTKPTRQLDPPLGGETLWRLVSHLSVNYLSLSQFDGSLKALQEILRLHAIPGDPAMEQQINGIVEMHCRPSVRRIGLEAWRGFVRGVDVELTFDESAYVGSSAILLASVVNRFLGLYATVNAYVGLTAKLRSRDGVWKRWPARAGDQTLL
ncbi:MAG: type VI secretion system baseplate subunit TssF [Alphaproteobacteria bacterium]